ncbi:hypothetical protein Sjap_011233 [Stephania japonica]|uniref:RanBP2-type domain-containing protein n=1 Tax=Stephania japonica TaxID=461633 RepID=A0AAP0JB00_9MAGN
MSRPGDWNCRMCQHLNFSWRDSCHRCGNSRYSEIGDYGISSTFSSSIPLPGDWFCSAKNCGALNYASKTNCFKCGMVKDESASGSEGIMQYSTACIGLPGWRPGDWMCTRPGCNEHNYASRMECFRCSTPREYYSNSSY